MWFLADPVEDNPNRTWEDYRRNYECTVIASLFFPEAWGFEVMPWPSRIFQGRYRKADLTTKGAEGIPADYATEILTIINSLNDMEQRTVLFDSGTKGIGVLVSDSMMFQVGEPHVTPTDGFFGLTLPLLKRGIPVRAVHLENLFRAGCLDGYRLLILSYEFMKPLKAEYHRVLADWVKKGNVLMYFGDGSDPYHAVREWWNTPPMNYATPAEHLFEVLGLPRKPETGQHRVGRGSVFYGNVNPAVFAERKEGAEKFVAAVKRAFAQVERSSGERSAARWKEQNYLHMVRGPYNIIAVLDESVSDGAYVFWGNFVDLLDPRLAVRTKVELKPGERGFLYDILSAKRSGARAKVLASASRIRGEQVSARSLRFNSRGPSGTTAAMRILLPREPRDVSFSKPVQPAAKEWDARSQTLLLVYENVPGGMDIAVEW